MKSYGNSPKEKKGGHKDGAKPGNSYVGGSMSPRMVQTSSKMRGAQAGNMADCTVGCYKPSSHAGTVGVSGKQSNWKHVASNSTS